ncbi:MAG: hypothetical protein WD097_03655 [Balneolales bacterium]
MAEKEYIGLALDVNRIYTARLRNVRGAMKLVAIETLELPKLVDDLTQQQQQQVESESASDAVFGFEDEDDSGDFESIDLEEETEEKESEDADDFDMAEEEDAESKGEETNEQVLGAWFNRVGNKKLHIGANIPQGKTIFQQLENVLPKKMKKNERAEFFTNKLAPIYNEEINPEQYTWDVNEEGNGWLISFDNDNSFLNLIDLSETFFNGKAVIREQMSDEVLQTGFLRTHYNFPEGEITGLISIGAKTTRLLFLNGDQLIHVLPVINEGSKSKKVLETIFSKLLFEIDKGTLPALHRLMIMQNPDLGERPRDFFRSQFEDIEVELFQPDPEKLILPDEYSDNPAVLQPYITAIAAAHAASGADRVHYPALSLLPEYIKERQRVFKLEWHGMILLVLIAFTPLMINKWYQEHSAEKERLTQAISVVDSRIAELRPIAEEVELLMTEQVVIEELNERLTELSRNSLLWSETLGQLNRGMSGIRNTWLTNLQVSGEHLDLQGYSLYRERIPRVSEIFDDAHVLQVTEGGMRGTTVYSFSLRVNNFRDAGEHLSPDLPDPDGELIMEISDEEIVW